MPDWVALLYGQHYRGDFLICHLPLALRRSAELPLESPEVWLTPTNVTGNPNKGGDSVGGLSIMSRHRGVSCLCVLVSESVYLCCRVLQ